jgi:hypothetical protein
MVPIGDRDSDWIYAMRQALAATSSREGLNSRGNDGWCFGWLMDVVQLQVLG